MEKKNENSFMNEGIEYEHGKFTMYYPILKGKRGELKALSILNLGIKSLTVPVIELVNGCKSNVIKYLKEEWAFEGNEVFIDPYILLKENNYNFNEVSEIFNSLKTNGVNVITVVRVDYSDGQLNSIKGLLTDGLRIAVRITRDFTQPEYFEVAIERIKRTFGCTESNINLIIDYSYIDEDTVVETISNATNLVNYLSSNGYLSITVAAGSFIKDLSDIIPDTVVDITRYEWELWNNLISIESLSDIISYGDYATRYPIYEYDSQAFAGSSSIRYTTETGFLILRGQRPDIHPDGMGQYHSKCNILVNNPLYDGADFSIADAQINDCASKAISSGNPETWVKISTARHIEKIVHLLL